MNILLTKLSYISQFCQDTVSNCLPIRKLIFGSHDSSQTNDIGGNQSTRMQVDSEEMVNLHKDYQEINQHEEQKIDTKKLDSFNSVEQAMPLPQEKNQTKQMYNSQKIMLGNLEEEKITNKKELEKEQEQDYFNLNQQKNGLIPDIQFDSTISGVQKKNEQVNFSINNNNKNDYQLSGAQSISMASVDQANDKFKCNDIVQDHQDNGWFDENDAEIKL